MIPQNKLDPKSGVADKIWCGKTDDDSVKKDESKNEKRKKRDRKEHA